MAQANPSVMAVVNSTDPADKPYLYESPDRPTRCSAPILVAKSDAPTIGHAIFLPPRKKLELFSLAFFLYAMYKPKAILPIITKEKTSQSREVKVKFI